MRRILHHRVMLVLSFSLSDRKGYIDVRYIMFARGALGVGHRERSQWLSPWSK